MRAFAREHVVTLVNIGADCTVDSVTSWATALVTSRSVDALLSFRAEVGALGTLVDVSLTRCSRPTIHTQTTPDVVTLCGPSSAFTRLGAVFSVLVFRAHDTFMVVIYVLRVTRETRAVVTSNSVCTFLGTQLKIALVYIFA